MSTCLFEFTSSTPLKAIAVKTTSSSRPPSSQSTAKRKTRLAASTENEFREWVIRQWFNNPEATSKPWYDPSVTVDSVLDKVEEHQRTFPLSIKDLRSFYQEILECQSEISDPTVNKLLNEVSLAPTKNDKPFDPLEVKIVRADTEGELTIFKDIAKAMGYSQPFVCNVYTKAVTKTRLMSPEYGLISQEDVDDTMIDAMQESISEFIEVLDNHETADEFFDWFVKEKIATKRDMESMVTPVEREVIERMMESYTDEVISDILAEDLFHPSGNVIKTFQLLYSRAIYQGDALLPSTQ